jgi:hypothetical protein
MAAARRTGFAVVLAIAATATTLALATASPNDLQATAAEAASDANLWQLQADAEAAAAKVRSVRLRVGARTHAGPRTAPLRRHQPANATHSTYVRATRKQTPARRVRRSARRARAVRPGLRVRHTLRHNATARSCARAHRRRGLARRRRPPESVLVRPEVRSEASVCKRAARSGARTRAGRFSERLRPFAREERPPCRSSAGCHQVRIVKEPASPPHDYI